MFSIPSQGHPSRVSESPRGPPANHKAHTLPHSHCHYEERKRRGALSATREEVPLGCNPFPCGIIFASHRLSAKAYRPMLPLRLAKSRLRRLLAAQHLRVLVTRELSAKLTEGEKRYAPLFCTYFSANSYHFYLLKNVPPVGLSPPSQKSDRFLTAVCLPARSRLCQSTYAGIHYHDCASLTLPEGAFGWYLFALVRRLTSVPTAGKRIATPACAPVRNDVLLGRLF